MRSKKEPKTLKDLIPISEQLDQYSADELRDPDTIIALYGMFAVDEVLFSADPKAIPGRVLESLKEVFEEYQRKPKPNLRSAMIRLHSIVDSIECCLGPRDGGNEGDAIRRLRRFEDKIVARRGK